MQNGMCPECGGTEIYTKAEAIWGYAGGIFIKMGGFWKKEIRLEGYVCAQCGHTTVRVPASDLKRLNDAFVTDGWTRVTEATERS